MTLEEALKAPRQFVDEGDQGTGQCGIHTLEEGDTDEVDVEEWQDGDEDEDEDEEEFFARVRRGSRRRGEEMDSDSAPGGESGEDEEEEEEEDRTRLASLLKVFSFIVFCGLWSGRLSGMRTLNPTLVPVAVRMDSPRDPDLCCRGRRARSTTLMVCGS